MSLSYLLRFFSILQDKQIDAYVAEPSQNRGKKKGNCINAKIVPTVFPPYSSPTRYQAQFIY